MIKNNVNIQFFLIALVISLFLPVYVLSYLKVVNFWSFSQSHIDYTFGLIPRGFFGEILNFFEKLGVTKRNSFAIIFIIINSFNILLFFQIIKKYFQNPYLQVVLALHPILILFSFNDLGAYQRHEQFGILIILLNYFILNYLNEIKKLNFFIFYLILNNIFIFVSILIHEINFFFIGFHFLMTLCFFNPKSKEVIINIIFIFLHTIFLIFLLKIDLNNDQIQFFRKIYEDQGLWFDGVVHFAVSQDFSIDRFNSNFLIFENFLINLILISYSLILLFYLLVDNESYKKKYYIFNLLFLGNIILLIIGATIGDFGRWLHIISISNISVYALLQNKKNIKKYEFKNKKKFLFLFIIFLSLFILKIPHSEMYKEKNIKIYKGYYFKVFSIFNSVVKKNNDNFFDINKRFKN